MPSNLTKDDPLKTLDAVVVSFPCRVLVLAPHPDDFDAIGVTMKQLLDQGCDLTLAVLTGGANGVETGYEDAQTNTQKEILRQQEQRNSCEFFGLDADSVHFLQPAFNKDGALAVNEANTLTLKHLLDRVAPELVCLPFGNDSNMTHQRVYALYRRARRFIEQAHIALLNRDVKTRVMPHDLVIGFNAEQADWKRELLRHHKSQQQRNLNTRDQGFDDRVLELNRQIAQELTLDHTYAEAFAIERFEP